MSTVACPGCGLPRAVDEIGTKACPLCDWLPVAEDVPQAKPKPTDRDPTAGLPADANELYSPSAPTPPRAYKRPPEASSRLLLVGMVTFILGTICGVGGVIGFQTINRLNAKLDESREPEVTATPNTIKPITRTPAPPKPAIAPMPHEPTPRLNVTQLESDFRLPPLQPPHPLGRTTVVELNQPDATYAVPFVIKNGEHIILKGKVKTLRVHALDESAVLDASALEAEVITVTGKIDNHSTLKLNAPHGTVHITGMVNNHSTVEINAPEGEVRFMLLTTTTREGSKIDNGSHVAITARIVDFKGDITGTDTKVSVTLTRSGLLKITAITGRAAVGYKSQAANSPPPDVIVGKVARPATFGKIE